MVELVGGLKIHAVRKVFITDHVCCAIDPHYWITRCRPCEGDQLVQEREWGEEVEEKMIWFTASKTQDCLAVATIDGSTDQTHTCDILQL